MINANWCSCGEPPPPLLSGDLAGKCTQVKDKAQPSAEDTSDPGLFTPNHQAMSDEPQSVPSFSTASTELSAKRRQACLATPV